MVFEAVHSSMVLEQSKCVGSMQSITTARLCCNCIWHSFMHVFVTGVQNYKVLAFDNIFSCDIYVKLHFRKPFIPIHHMEAHALTARLTNRYLHSILIDFSGRFADMLWYDCEVSLMARNIQYAAFSFAVLYCFSCLYCRWYTKTTKQYLFFWFWKTLMSSEWFTASVFFFTLCTVDLVIVIK